LHSSTGSLLGGIWPTPSIPIPYLAGDSKMEVVDRNLRAREDCINMLKYHWGNMQSRMKQLAKKKRSDRTFSVGDLVYVRL